MMRFWKSEVGAVVLWVAASIVFAAALTPWLFAWGKDFAASYGEDGGSFGWLAGSCERARVSRYFNRALLLGALLLFGPLWLRIRSLTRKRTSELPQTWAGIGWRIGLLHCATGFFATASLLWIYGIGAHLGGAYTPVDEMVAAKKFLTRAVLPAIGASIGEEWLFRALLLGLWLRVSGPWMASIGTAFVYAFVHFLEPPRGVELADPRAWWAGFELLGLVLWNFLDPRFIAAEFLTLFVIGLALAWARLRTGSLWITLGMHAGWVFAFKSYLLLHVPVEDSPLQPWFVGETLKAGLLPLVTLGLTWLLLAYLLRILPRGQFERG